MYTCDYATVNFDPFMVFKWKYTHDETTDL